MASARRGVAFTGAGISVESGIPHFRGEGGLWTVFDPYRVASIHRFKEDPTDYWTYSRTYRRTGAEPNPAHRAVVDMERRGHVRAVITQNTDGLHQKAGSREVVELHGSGANVICLDCERRYPREEIDRLNRERCPPNCPGCGGRYLKPTVVLFGEPLPVEAVERAQQLSETADLMLVVGSSLQVYPAAALPQRALAAGATLCIVNAEPTPYDELAAVVVHGKAGEVLPAIVSRLG
jgi:NAD-dependent deacetylase